ncbi:hypothetical protein [Streptomyces sp. NBC_01497]|uniref:hypothetical protein n=1 Tax=Streptomyces sp. NBC_01497 TaxID=2903885 RepID=UPI002E34355D|nr:hypothetical protein [Streptomyces sp. NBC_01497]
MGVRKVAKGVGEIVVEIVGGFLDELIPGLIGCVLLLLAGAAIVALGLVGYAAWDSLPR